jgi:predicted Ser/Thr protein kinase
VGRAVSEPDSQPDDPRLLRLLAAVAANSPLEAEPEPQPLLAVGTWVAHFQIRGVLGQGGMGVVYLAFDERLGREVALKVLGGPAAKTLYLSEARAASAVEDARIARVFEIGEADGRAFVAMERIAGVSLRTWLRESSAPQPVRFALGLEICRAVACLHRAGLVHCDLKPENVMVEAPGRIKLVDFGLARRAGPGSSTPVRGGTRGYLAPEVAAGDSPDPRADVFALGVLLDELLSPRRSSRLSNVLAQARAADPTRRPQSAAELAAAVEACAQRRPGAALRVALPALALIGTGALALWVHRSPVAAPSSLSLKRLTGRPLDQPISDAAISVDGKRVAWVDDSGAFVGAYPLLGSPTHVEVEGRAVGVRRLLEGNGWQVVSELASGERVVWTVPPDGRGARVWGRGRFRAPSISPDGTHLVTVDNRRVLVFAKGEQRPERSFDVAPSFPCVAQWSPDGRFFAVALAQPSTAAVSSSVLVLKADTFERVLQIESPLLMQFFSVPVIAWAPSGALLYALSDAPGAGSGTAIWMRAVDARGSFAAPVRLSAIDRQSVSAIALSSSGELLTLRSDTRTVAATAAVDSDGRLGAPGPSFTEEELDSRFSSFGPDGVLGMSLRESVPRLLGEGLATGDAAQTWPEPGFKPGQIFFWETALPLEAGLVDWHLVLESGGARRTLGLPFSVREGLSLTRPPPTSTRVRCAPRTGICVIAHTEGDELSFWRLSDDGEARLSFRLTTENRLNLAWDLAPDASALVVADGPNSLALYGMDGERLARWSSSTQHRVQSLACANHCDAVFFSGLGDEPKNFQIARTDWKSESTAYASGATQALDLRVAPSGATVGLTLRSYDTDLWLTQLQ